MSGRQGIPTGISMGKTIVPSGRRKKLGLEPDLALVEAAGELMVIKSVKGPLRASEEEEEVEVEVAVAVEEEEVAVEGSEEEEEAVSSSCCW